MSGGSKRPIRLLLTALLVGACGSTAAPAAPAATAPRSASPSAIPSASDALLSSAKPNAAEGYLVYLPDYQFAQVPAAVEKQLNEAFATARSTGVATALAVRSVTKQQDSTGLIVLVMALDPTLASLPNAREGLEQDIGAPRTQIYVNGRPASYFPDLGGLPAIAWLQQPYYVMVYGADRPTIERFSEALIFANGGAVRGPAPEGSVLVEPLKAGAPVILRVLIKNGPSVATVRCRYSIDNKGTSQAIAVKLNVDGAGSCVADFTSNEAAVRGHFVTFIISREDGTEFGQTTVTVPK